MRSALVILLALAILTPSQNADGADAALIEAARKEGKVVWYTTLIVNQAIRPLKAAFEKKYPGIELQYARADETPTAAKILEEGVAGRVQARRAAPTICRCLPGRKWSTSKPPPAPSSIRSSPVNTPSD